MFLKNFALLFSLLLIFTFLKPTPVLASTYYFQEEFNEEKLPNTLDSSKWTIYQNAPDSVTTIQETGGNLQMLQQNSTPQFPLIVSKNALPEGDFSIDIKFKYNNVVGGGTGFALSEVAPINGGGFLNVFTISMWQDTMSYKMRIGYGDGTSAERIVFQTNSMDINEHVFTVKYSGQKYFIYLDRRLIYTSQDTSKKVKYLWLGNPDKLNPVVPFWTSFQIDYIRTTMIPTPFLDLPWGYQGKGMDFNEAALSINSFFDHEYPLLSSGLAEPVSTSVNIVSFIGETNNKWYSSHDGYDYGLTAKVKFKDPVLAAASGLATYIDPKKPREEGGCAPCGNMIIINHGNGYQTRYLHLYDEGLIASVHGQSVYVSQGQPIGKVGFTGNVKPNDERGAHIHFGVFQDKNGDGNFNDNIPDGVTDPFGWQSQNPDPWETYSFSYLGQNRTGNKSYYLWKNNTAKVAQTLTSQEANYNVGKYALNFPAGSTSQNVILNIQSTPQTKASPSLVSLGSTLTINVTNNQGNKVTQFANAYTITVDFSQTDISRFKLDTLAFYSSDDGTNWTKEVTSFPGNTTASTTVNHASHFALMGERKDTLPPVTIPSLIGEEGQPGWYRSDVQVILTAQDDDLGVYYQTYKINDEDWELYTDPLVFNQEGYYRLEFYAVDQDENTEEVKSVEFDIDKTPPTITGSFSPSPNPSGWNNTDVAVHFDCSDSLSGIESCGPYVVMPEEGEGQSVTGTATDKAGNSTSFTVSPINIDKNPPQLTATATSKGNAYLPNTWTNGDVTVAFVCTDNLSGVTDFTSPITINSEGSNQKASGSCVDTAGNQISIEFTGINIDKTAPAITLDVNPKIIWPPDNRMFPVTVTGFSTDANLYQTKLSVDDEYNQVTPTFILTGSDINLTFSLEASRKGDDLDGRTYLIEATTEDLAGNTTSEQIHVLVPHDERN